MIEGVGGNMPCKSLAIGSIIGQWLQMLIWEIQSQPETECRSKADLFLEYTGLLCWLWTPQQSGTLLPVYLLPYLLHPY